MKNAKSGATEPEYVEVRAIEPFIGSYPCGVSEADTISTIEVDDPATGLIVKRPQARKRFRGSVPTRRLLTSDETSKLISDELPENLKVVGPVDLEGLKRRGPYHEGGALKEVWADELPDPPTVRLPRQIALDLVDRGLACLA